MYVKLYLKKEQSVILSHLPFPFLYQKRQYGTRERETETDVRREEMSKSPSHDLI